jgi:hypothetical protein
MGWRDLKSRLIFLRFCVAPRNLVAVGLSSGRRRGDRGVEDGAALRDFDGALRNEPPNVFQ